MDKITKKEFRNLLETKQNCLVDSFFERKSIISSLEDELSKLDQNQFTNFRTVINVNSNSICFSNWSSCYFNQTGTKNYYRTGNYIIAEINTIDCFGSGTETTFGYTIYLIK